MNNFGKAYRDMLIGRVVRLLEDTKELGNVERATVIVDDLLEK